MKFRMITTCIAVLFAAMMFGMSCSDSASESVAKLPDDGGSGGGGINLLPGTCGDGTLNIGEECDDSNTVAGDGCDENCMNEGSAVTPPTTTPEEILEFPEVVDLKAILPNESDLQLVVNKVVVSPAPTRINRHLWLKVGFESAVPVDQDPEFILEAAGNPVGELKITKNGDDSYLVKTVKPLHHNVLYTLKVETRRTDPPEYASFEIPIGNAGDINGDGLSDFVVGAPLQPFKGMAYVFFGANPINYRIKATDAANVKIAGAMANAEFGSAVAVGDINGDGYADIVVGAPKENQGCVYVFHGSADIQGDLMSTTNNTYICRTNGAITLFGGAIALGDLNGDGFDDLIVGESKAWRVTNTAPIYESTGVVDVFWGSKNGIASRSVSDTESADVSYFSTTKYQRVGYSLAAGDLNGDGFDDVIIGALGTDKTAVEACRQGKVYLALGASDLGQQTPSMNLDDSANATTLIGQGCVSDDTDRFGVSVAVASGDEKDKVLIGSKSNSYEFSLGSPIDFLLLSLPPNDVIVGWLGNAIGLGLSSNDELRYKESQGSWQSRQETAGSAYGCSISPAGDLDRNGTPDFIVGARLAGTSATNHRGRIYVNIDEDSIIGDSHSELGTAVAGGRLR